MSINEILDSEKRDNNNLYDIHFYLEGIFWKAYEWSAYLSEIFPSSLGKGQRLKPLKKITKSNTEGYVQVGLQLSSFEKYFPNVIGNNNVFTKNEKHIVIHAKDFFNKYDFDDYSKILKQWKNNIDIKKKEVNEITSDCNEIINKLFNEIVSYQIENKNLIDNLKFLSYIKNKVMDIKKATIFYENNTTSSF